MKRSGFDRQPYHRASKPLTPAVRLGVYAPASEVVVAVPKGVKAKPGKRAPTVEEAKWMDDIVRFGCVACFVSKHQPPCPHAEVHHLLRGGVRIGHLYTIPLGHYHHRGASPNARHPWRKRFEAAFGTELELLAMLKVKLGYFDKYEVTT